MAKRRARTVAKRSTKRPLGVTVICILGWIGALLFILGGLALLGVGAIGGMLGGVIGAFLGVAGTLFGGLLLIVGIINFVVLYWLWQMKKSGWTWTMIFQVISLIIALVQSNLIGVVIPAIIVLYLWMNKKLFK